MGIIHERATTDDLRRLSVHINLLHMNAETDEERDSLFRCWEWVQEKARNIDDAWEDYRIRRHVSLVKMGIRPAGSSHEDYVDSFLSTDNTKRYNNTNTKEK